MRCEEAEDLILRRQDAGLAEPENSVLGEHLADCERCRLFAAGVKKVHELLERERATTPAPGDVTRLWGAVAAGVAERGHEARKHVFWLRAGLVGAVAAAAAGIVLAAGLWRWSAELRQEVQALKAANARLSEWHAQEQGPTVWPGPRRGAVQMAHLTRTAQLYWELSDFYRMPVLWVLESERSVEMKLGLDAGATTAPEVDADLLFLEVVLQETPGREAPVTVRIVARPGQRVAAALTDRLGAPGTWGLECVPTVTADDHLTVALKVEHVGADGPALLMTQVALTPGSATQVGSLMVHGRTYSVEVFGQRAPKPNSTPAAKSKV